jgi:hypothetical protein
VCVHAELLRDGGSRGEKTRLALDSCAWFSARCRPALQRRLATDIVVR